MKNVSLDNQCVVVEPGGGGGTPIYGLYRYVPRDRVCFLRFSVLNRVSLLLLLALCSRCYPQIGYLNSIS